MMFPVLQAVLGPGDCLLSGTCGAVARQIGPHSGMMYLAIGFVVLGLAGLWREWRRRSHSLSS